MGFYCRWARWPTRRHPQTHSISPRYQTVKLVISISYSHCKEHFQHRSMIRIIKKKRGVPEGRVFRSAHCGPYYNSNYVSDGIRFL